MAQPQDPTQPPAVSDAGDGNQRDDEGGKPFYKSPLKLLGALWLGKKLIAGGANRARTHRRRVAIKELRADQRERKRRERAAQARAALREDRRQKRRARAGRR